MKIFLNTKGKNEKETPELLVHFLKYMEESTDACAVRMQEPVIDKLHGRLDALKRSRDLEAYYMTLGEWLDNEAHIEAQELAKDMAEELAKGMAAKAVAEDVIDILELKYGLIPEIHDKIILESDIQILKSWHKLAVLTSSLDEFVSKM